MYMKEYLEKCITGCDSKKTSDVKHSFEFSLNCQLSMFIWPLHVSTDILKVNRKFFRLGNGI